MPLKRTYYNLHQVITGQYTAGNEFVLPDGRDYVGLYHILPNGKCFTGSRPSRNSVELLEKRYNANKEVLFYNNLKGFSTSNYVSPVAFYPIPSTEDYERGVIERFFVQKRNNPERTIVEIDVDQFNKINVVNRPGINGVIWRGVIVNWRISRLPAKDVFENNRLEVVRVGRKFPGLDKYLTNFLEFYK